MTEAFICDAIQIPIDRYGGSPSAVRASDLGAVPLRVLMAHNPQVDQSAIDDVIFGCTSQAGGDSHNVAHMLSLLVGLPNSMPGSTVNHLRGSGMDATGTAARVIRSGEAALMIAEGVENMSRASFVMGKVASAFSHDAAIYNTTIGWRFINPLMKTQHGVDSMPGTAENVVIDYKVNREGQDRFALHSQTSAVRVQEDDTLVREITPVVAPQRKGSTIVVDRDEHLRATSMEAFAKLRGVVRPDDTVTAGNASGMNDGVCALLLANEVPAECFGPISRTHIVGMVTTGMPPRVMSIGPAPASQEPFKQLGSSVDQMGVIELNEAFAVQGLAVMR